MNIFKALEFFCLYSGMDMSEASEFVPLIASSAAMIERRLKDTSLCETDEAAEVAAAHGFYRYVLSQEASLGTAFTAGSVKVDSSKRTDLALENYRSVAAMHSHLFIDDIPVFFGVTYEKDN